MQDVERSAGDELTTGDAAREDLGAAAKRLSPRRWTADEKARIVRESFRSGKRVSEVARRHGLSRKRLTAWRSLARQGKLSVPSLPASGPVAAGPEAGPAFAAVEVEDGPDPVSTSSVAVEAGGVTVRIGGDSSVARIAEIAAALRGLR